MTKERFIQIFAEEGKRVGIPQGPQHFAEWAEIVYGRWVKDPSRDESETAVRELAAGWAVYDGF